MLGHVRDQRAVVTKAEAKRDFPSKIAASRLLVGLHLANPLADSVSLGLGEGGSDRQKQLGKAVA